MAPSSSLSSLLSNGVAMKDGDPSGESRTLSGQSSGQSSSSSTSSSSGPRALADYLADWYLSSVDVRCSHSDNVQKHLRGLVRDATESILFARPTLATTGGHGGKEGGGDGGRSNGPKGEWRRTSGPAATMTGSNGGGSTSVLGPCMGWRDYLDQHASFDDNVADANLDGALSVSTSTSTSTSTSSPPAGKNDARHADHGDGRATRLTRRSEARLDAFLRLVSLAIPNDPLPTLASLARERERRKAHSSVAAGGATSPIGSPDLPPSGGAGRGGGGRGDVPALAGLGGSSSSSSSSSSSPLSVRPVQLERPSSPPGKATKKKQQQQWTLSTALSGFVIASDDADGSGGKEKKKPFSFLSPSDLPPKQGDADPSATTAVAAAAAAASAVPPTQQQQFSLKASPSLSPSSSVSSSLRTTQRIRYPQIEKRDLSVRLELYIRSLRRVRDAVSGNSNERKATACAASGDECVVHLEPPRAIRARIANVVKSFVSTVGCVRSISPVLTRLLVALTMELLAVDVLSDDVTLTIGRVVEEYEHLTSFASLAFLSTPEESGRTHLTPLVANYVCRLQSGWRALVSNCELERMLRCAIDPSVRRTFKTAVFRSIGHLLDVCRSYRPYLEGMKLAKSDERDIVAACTDPAVVRQSLRDLRREIILVNGRVLPPAHSLEELVSLLTEALALGPMTLSHRDGVAGGVGLGRRRRRRKKKNNINWHGRTKTKSKEEGKNGMKKSQSAPSVTMNKSLAGSASLHGGLDSESESEPEQKGTAVEVAAAALSSSAPGLRSQGGRFGSVGVDADSGNDDDVDDDDDEWEEKIRVDDGSVLQGATSESELSSGNEGDTDGLHSEGEAEREDGGEKEDDEAQADGHMRAGRNATFPLSRGRSFDLGTIDMLTRRLLVAASRTGTGGDAYFVVRDLFGGEDVEVVPSKSLPTYASTMSGIPHRAAAGRGGTIELLVRLSSITIKCHGTYDVYPIPLVEECEPLIQLHTTTTETVALREVRMDEPGRDGKGGRDGGGGESSGGEEGRSSRTVLMLEERKTDAMGERTLSIRPASYERVHVLNTPS